jgi:hypothetical protein
MKRPASYKDKISFLDFENLIFVKLQFARVVLTQGYGEREIWALPTGVVAVGLRNPIFPSRSPCRMAYIAA